MAKSTTTNINRPQLVGDNSDNILVPTYNWTEYFAGVFRTFVGIKSYQHFAFSTDEPGVVQYKKYAGSGMQKFKLLKGELPVAPMPENLQPKGLDLARRQYLDKEIREFCCAGPEDLVCPLVDTFEEASGNVRL